MKKPTLTKKEAAQAVAAITKQPSTVVEDVIEKFFKQIETALASGRRVEFRGFGVWEARMSKERIGRNPRHPENGEVIIPSRPSVKFKVGKELGDAIAHPPVVAVPIVVAEPVA